MEITYGRITFDRPPTPKELEEITAGTGYTRILAIVRDEETCYTPTRQRFLVYTETTIRDIGTR
jgi:hypothetical protein